MLLLDLPATLALDAAATAGGTTSSREGGQSSSMSARQRASGPSASVDLPLTPSPSLSLTPKKELVMALERVVADCQLGTAQFVSGEEEQGSSRDRVSCERCNVFILPAVSWCVSSCTPLTG